MHTAFSRTPRRLPRRLRRFTPLALALLCLAGPVHAIDANLLPTGGSVGAGSGRIVAVDSGLRIDQTSARLTLDWGSFNIGSAQTVQFVQPTRSAVVLNRVAATGGLSTIAGRLSANGNVLLLNANGVMFEGTAQVDVGGLVASTLAMSDDDFFSGNYRLRGNPLPSVVTNLGRLTAHDGGAIALVAPVVSNRGTIVARLGSVALASGSEVTLDFTGDKLINVVVDAGAPFSRASNTGRLLADGGLVVMTARTAGDVFDSVINHSGEIRAARVSQRGGVVRLDGDGSVNLDGQVAAGAAIDVDAATLNGSSTAMLDTSGASGGHVTLQAGALNWLGTIRADGTSGLGGVIDLGGKTVTLSGAQLHADGRTGGGAVHLGGGWQGEGDEAHAERLRVDASSVLSADATGSGKGGTLAVWSELQTAFNGAATARGGPQGGDGGRIEVSSNGALALGSVPDAAARQAGAAAGELLLDHRDIHIAAVRDGDAADPDRIEPWLIEAALSRGTAVHLQASNDITVADALQAGSQTDAPVAALTLQAGRSIHVNADISTQRGAVSLIANDRAADTVAGRERGAGAAAIEMQRGDGAASRIDAGSGDVSIQLLKSGGAMGAVRLNDVSGNHVGVFSLATGDGPALDLNGRLSASAAGNALVVGARSMRFGTGTGGVPFDTPNGRWLAYADAPGSIDFGSVVSPGNLFGRRLADNAPDSIDVAFGNRFVYSVRPMLQVTAQTQRRDYGDSNAAFGWTVDGLVAGDTVDSTLSGALTSSGTRFSHAGRYAIEQGTLAERLGYRLDYTAADLVVTPRPVTLGVNDQGRAVGRANPAEGTATVVGGSMVFGDRVGSIAVHSTLAADAPLGAVAALTGSDAQIVAGSHASRASDYAFAYRDGQLAVDSVPPSTPDAGTVAGAHPEPLPVTDGGGVAGPVPSPVVVAVAPADSLAFQPEQFLAAAESRHDLFTGLFDASLRQLRRDPSAGDLPPCPEHTDDRRGVDDELCMPSHISVVVQGDGELNVPPTAAGTTAASTTPTVAAVVEPVIQRKRAYLIGNNAYSGGIPRLRTPIADASALAGELRERFGYEVELVTNATQRETVALFRRISAQSRPGDSVLVYYAGHGYEIKETRAGYWIPSDASTDDPHTWISNADITRFLSMVAANQVILVSDSCFSGALAREAPLDPSRLALDRSRILARRSVVVMSSGGEEPVFDGGAGGHSIFAGSLLDTLHKARASWQVGSTLYQAVKQQIETRYPQYPRYSAAPSAGHVAGGDYLFEQNGSALPTRE